MPHAWNPVLDRERAHVPFVPRDKLSAFAGLGFLRPCLFGSDPALVGCARWILAVPGSAFPMVGTVLLASKLGCWARDPASTSASAEAAIVHGTALASFVHLPPDPSHVWMHAFALVWSLVPRAHAHPRGSMHGMHCHHACQLVLLLCCSCDGGGVHNRARVSITTAMAGGPGGADPPVHRTGPSLPSPTPPRRATVERDPNVHAWKRVGMLVRVASSAHGGSRRALPWARVKEWPKKPPNPVLGIDPDVSGALAMLEGREGGWSLQIHDVPTVLERVGTRTRRRHCPEGIACAIRNLELPPGCVAYVEMARPLPQNGRQGWYGSGFGYGVWMGALAAHGVETVAVHPHAWKKDMMLTKANQTDAKETTDVSVATGTNLEPLNRMALKDRSREIAAYVFPQVMDEVKRKKDHGRAEAVLLAAWGCGMRCEPHDIQEDVLSLLDIP